MAELNNINIARALDTLSHIRDQLDGISAVSETAVNANVNVNCSDDPLVRLFRVIDGLAHLAGVDDLKIQLERMRGEAA